MGRGAPCGRTDSMQDLLPARTKAGGCVARTTTPFLPFPWQRQELGFRYQSPRLKGLDVFGGKRMEQGDPRAKTAWGKSGTGEGWEAEAGHGTSEPVGCHS
jgi:hypothetical protein